jgi:predicted nucleic acid-binding protein
MVVIDATTLLLLIDPKAKPPRDPKTLKPLEKCKERLEFLVQTLTEAGTRVVVPAPVLSELLVRAGEARGEFLSEITSTYAFVIAPFETKAAVELSFLLDADLKPRRKKLGEQETWAKMKFDRQIIAIAKVSKVNTIYSDDTTLAAVARANGISVTHTWELPLPPVKSQQELDFPDDQKGRR